MRYNRLFAQCMTTQVLRQGGYTVKLAQRCIVALVFLYTVSMATAAPLAYHVTADDEWKLALQCKTTLVANLGEMPYNLVCMSKVTIAHDVQSVTETGGFVQTLTYKVEKLDVVLNGSPMQKAPPEMKPLTIETNALGAPVNIKGIEGSLKPTDFDLAKLLIFLPPQYPAREVKVGESWEATTAIQGQAVPMTGKILTPETRDGVAVTCIENTFILTPDVINKLLPIVSALPDLKVSSGKVTVKLTAAVDAATGIPRRVQGTCDINGALAFSGLTIPCKISSSFTTDVPPPAAPAPTPAK
jgi:hypothetical protein